MKEKVSGVIKWGLILIIAGAILYLVCPKYDFKGPQGLVVYRCNKVTGHVEQMFKGKWTNYSEALAKRGK